jgi:cell division protein FtsI/penicillin-binding protein 2
MRPFSRFALAGGLFALTSALLALDRGSADAAPAAQPAAVVRTASAPKRPTREELLEGLDLSRRELVAQRLVAPLDGDRQAVLTLAPGLDRFLSELLERYEVPYAGVVAMEPQTGKVLAYVSHSSAEPSARDQARDASAPAASLFKLVTSAALLEHGVGPDTSTCYHGGASKLTMAELVDNPKLDTACLSFSQALGWSVNAVFGKLALKRLDAKTLARYAGAFGFGETLPFDLPTQPSTIEIPGGDVEFARTAAGFWHMRLSPLHAAMLASTIANQGKMMRPQIVERVLDEKGKLLLKSEPVLHRSVLERRTADQIARMMRQTVTSGTAKKFFFDEKGNPFLPGVEVAAKTGTLSKERPYRGYTWWIGFAPANAPKIAVAALIVNSPKWRIKAGYVGREALRHYLFTKPSPSPSTGGLAQRR